MRGHRSPQYTCPGSLERMPLRPHLHLLHLPRRSPAESSEAPVASRPLRFKVLAASPGRGLTSHQGRKVLLIKPPSSCPSQGPFSPRVPSRTTQRGPSWALPPSQFHCPIPHFPKSLTNKPLACESLSQALLLGNPNEDTTNSKNKNRTANMSIIDSV